MQTAVCPGSFDPVTSGHIDVFERAATMFEEIVVGVFSNPNKQPLFTMEERVELLREATSHIPNVRIESFSGLLSDYVQQQHAVAIVRGLRTSKDFEDEYQRALLIKKLDPKIETVCLMAGKDYSFVSSSGIKELAKFHGEIKGLVPKCVEVKLKQKFMDL